MEYFDVYTAGGERTGKTIPEGAELPKGLYTLVSNVIIMNAEGRFLLQQRSLQKQFYPGIWDFSGGRVRAGESSREGAAREVFEEVGLRLHPDKLQKLAHTVMPWSNIVDTYLARADFTLADCSPQESEVAGLALLSYGEARAILGCDKWLLDVFDGLAAELSLI